MSNTNCLKGMACPHCKSEDSFQISVNTFITMTDDGCDDYGKLEWDDDSACICEECGFRGLVLNFREGSHDPE